ncbi:hypothetical protein GGR52DRAFT_518599 [Hypoxylon sp. FL1284]|nr:hypothetical protein GGR52DRAFT_518599 [Hypoxylon sp. FL1284]
MHPISLVIVALSALILAMPHSHSHSHGRRQLGSALSSTIVDSLTGALGVSKGRHKSNSGCDHGFNNAAFTACINDCVDICVDGEAGCHECFDACSPHIGCEDGISSNKGDSNSTSKAGEAARHRNSTSLAYGSA